MTQFYIAFSLYFMKKKAVFYVCFVFWYISCFRWRRRWCHRATVKRWKCMFLEVVEDKLYSIAELFS